MSAWIVSFAFFTFSIAFEIKFLCLKLVIIISLSTFISFKLNIFDITPYNFSIPSPFKAEILITFVETFVNLSSLSAKTLFKSALFNKIIDFFPFAIFKISKSSSVKSLEESNIAIIKSASLATSFDLAIPIFSTSSFASLIPAVSINFSGIPSIFTNSSIVSLVVPSYSVTIALSSFKTAFKSDDFPAFGFPIIAVFIPSLISLPLSKLFSKLISFLSTDTNISIIWAFVTSSTSYSG